MIPVVYRIYKGWKTYMYLGKAWLETRKFNVNMTHLQVLQTCMKCLLQMALEIRIILSKFKNSKRFSLEIIAMNSTIFSLPSLKPRIRDKRLYSMGTSGLMLIPVTHPTQCVAECAKCGFSGQANMAWGPSTELETNSMGPSPKRSPIQYGHPNYIEAYTTAKKKRPNQLGYLVGIWL